MLEALSVARALGFSEEAVSEKNVDDVIESTARIHRREDSRHKASMLVDLEMGRPMEVDVIIGWLVRKAREMGVDVPVSWVLCFAFAFVRLNAKFLFRVQRLELMYGLLTVMQGQILRDLENKKSSL